MNRPMQKPELEICAGDLRSISAAALGGADRVEICCALPLGGLTPQASSLSLSEPFADRLRRHVLLRPRPGDFLYTEEEMLCMEADLSEPSLARADGFVIGVLRADGSVDTERTSRLMRCGAAFGAKSFTFHRAFDMTADPFRALEDIIALGFDRVLTSGCAASAEEGIEMLRRLNEQGAGRITIMAGGGINPGNLRRIAAETGITSFHASCSVRIPSGMSYRNDATRMGAGSDDEYSSTSSDRTLVERLVEAVRSL